MADDHMLAKNSKVYMRANDPESLQKAVNASVAEVGGGDTAVSDEDFRVIASLDPKLCGHLITALTSPSDTPVGAEVPVYIVQEDGKLNKDNTVNPNQAAVATDSGGFPGWGWICIGVVVAVFVMLFLIAAGASRR
jgi:hypothetical protein